MNQSSQNTVSHPAHYAGDGKIECMDAMASMVKPVAGKVSITAAYWWISAFKYLWRWPLKNGSEDLAKCSQCLDYLRESLAKEESE